MDDLLWYCSDCGVPLPYEDPCFMGREHVSAWQSIPKVSTRFATARTEMFGHIAHALMDQLYEERVQTPPHSRARSEKIYDQTVTALEDGRL